MENFEQHISDDLSGIGVDDFQPATSVMESYDYDSDNTSDSHNTGEYTDGTSSHQTNTEEATPEQKHDGNLEEIGIPLDEHAPLDDHGTIYSKAEVFEEPISPDVAQQIYAGCHFEPQNWENMDDGTKMNELNQLEQNLAEMQERLPVKIQAKDLDSFWDSLWGRKSYGYFDPNSGEIFINSTLLDSPKYLPDVIDTVIHEGIHAYQHQCVSGLIEHGDPAQVEQWAYNFEHYKPASLYGMRAYMEQPVEVFARENADRLTESLTLVA